MLDLMFGAVLALLAVRGWRRGLRREAYDLAFVLVGVFLAFRLGAVVAAVVAAAAGTSPGASRLVGGLAVFVVVVASGIAVRGFLGKAAAGSGMAHRAGGAVVASLGGVVLATLLCTVLAVAPLPGAVGGFFAASVVADSLTDPGGTAQSLVGGVAGDTVVRSVLRLQELVGTRHVVIGGSTYLVIPAVPESEVTFDGAAARDVFDLVNRDRVAAGAAPLAWSDALAEVAGTRARAMVAAGRLGHEVAGAGTVVDALAAAGLRVVVAGENVAVAATPADAHDGLRGSAAHRENVERREFRRGGVAVVPGPLGVVVVEVFTG